MTGRSRLHQTGCVTLQPPRMTPEGLEVQASGANYQQDTHRRGAVSLLKEIVRCHKGTQSLRMRLLVHQGYNNSQNTFSMLSPLSLPLSCSLSLTFRAPFLAILFYVYQVSLHTCPKALSRELCHVFPGVDLASCLAVPTSQRATLDLVSIGEPVEMEKDRLLNLVRLGGIVCTQSHGWLTCVCRNEVLLSLCRATVGLDGTLPSYETHLMKLYLALDLLIVL